MKVWEQPTSHQLSQPVRIFLCHCSGDKPAVRKLYGRLKADGFLPWLDEKDLIPGTKWREVIPKVVRESDVVLVCLSETSITKNGYVQKEIKFALDEADEKPDETIFIIPVRLAEVGVPERLSQWQWVNLFQSDGNESEDGYDNLARALRIRGNQIALSNDKQVESDANAMALILRQLNPNSDIARPSQGELEQSFKKISPAMREQIFDRAYNVRHDNWKSNKHNMELSIPVFRALIASDSYQVSHRNYGQLGFALHDQPVPDWKEAETQLSKAIAIRDSQGEKGWLWYEFIRASCRINMDPEFCAHRPSMPEGRLLILRDLQTVGQSDPQVTQDAMEDKSVTTWMAINGVTLQ